MSARRARRRAVEERAAHPGPAEAPGIAGPRRGRWRAAAAVGLVLLLSVALELPVIESRVQRDSGIHAAAACEILRGRVMYRDLWENRPPGIHYANALAFWLFGDHVNTLRASNMALIALDSLLFLLLARRLLPAPLAAATTAVFLLYVGGQANRDECDAIELYMIAPMILAALAGLRSLEGGRAAWAVAAGAAAAVAVLFKQPAASAGLALAGAVFVVWAGPGGLRRIGLAWLGMAAGALVVATSLLAFLAGHRALAHAWDCLFVYNRLYLRGVTLGERLDVLLYGLTRAGSAVPLWLGAGGFFLALAGAVSAVARQGTKAGFVSVLGRARHSPGWTFIGLWALFDLAGVCYPGYRSPHYFLQIVPSWLLLSAGFLRVVWPLQAGRGVLARWAGAAVLGATAVGLLAAAKAQADEALAAVRERMRERRFNRNEAMSFWVASYTEPDEAVAVWGAEATVNYLSGRCVASRYFFTYPMQMPGYDNERRVAEYLRDLERARPACIVDLSDESEWALPLFGGPKAVPRRFSCDPFDPVRDYVRRNYVHEPAVKVATVWVRRDLVERCRAWRQAGRRADWNERWRPGGRVR